jgi:hypothetical protein
MIDEYLKFIEQLKTKKYSKDLVLHKHHIIPKSMGGTNNPENLINLSVDDHIEAHLVLSSCFKKGTKEHNINLYAVRILKSKSIKLTKQMEKLIQDSYIGENNPFYGKTHSKKTKKIIAEKSSEQCKNISYSERYGENIDLEKKKRSIGVTEYFKNMTESEKKKRSENISKSLKGKLTGGNNPASRPIEIDGKIYSHWSEATKQLGKSVYKIKKYHKVRFLSKN